MSLKFCSPEKIPSEIKFYDKKILQMDVGKTGKIGYLKIDLKHDLQKNKTIITHQKSQVPLFIQKALYMMKQFHQWHISLFYLHQGEYYKVTGIGQISH